MGCVGMVRVEGDIGIAILIRIGVCFCNRSNFDQYIDRCDRSGRRSLSPAVVDILCRRAHFEGEVRRAVARR